MSFRTTTSILALAALCLPTTAAGEDDPLARVGLLEAKAFPGDGGSPTMMETVLRAVLSCSPDQIRDGDLEQVGESREQVEATRRGSPSKRLEQAIRRLGAQRVTSLVGVDVFWEFFYTRRYPDLAAKKAALTETLARLDTLKVPMWLGDIPRLEPKHLPVRVGDLLRLNAIIRSWIAARPRVHLLKLSLFVEQRRRAKKLAELFAPNRLTTTSRGRVVLGVLLADAIRAAYPKVSTRLARDPATVERRLEQPEVPVLREERSLGTILLKSMLSTKTTYVLVLPPEARVGTWWEHGLPGGSKMRHAIVGEREGKWIVEKVMDLAGVTVVEAWLVDPKVDISKKVEPGQRLLGNVTKAWVGLAGQVPKERPIMELPAMPETSGPRIKMTEGTTSLELVGRTWKARWIETKYGKTWVAQDTSFLLEAVDAKGKSLMVLTGWGTDAKPRLKWP